MSITRISLYSFNLTAFVTGTESVYCAVRDLFLNTVHINVVLKVLKCSFLKCFNLFRFITHNFRDEISVCISNLKLHSLNCELEGCDASHVTRYVT